MDNNTRTALKMLKDISDKQQEQINDLKEICSKNCNTNLGERLSSLEKSLEELKCKCESNQCCDNIENCCSENNECCDNSVVDDVLNN